MKNHINYKPVRDVKGLNLNLKEKISIWTQSGIKGNIKIHYFMKQCKDNYFNFRSIDVAFPEDFGSISQQERINYMKQNINMKKAVIISINPVPEDTTKLLELITSLFSVKSEFGNTIFKPIDYIDTNILC